MSQDRYLKGVLTVIAVALSVIALAQLDAPAAATAVEFAEGPSTIPPRQAASPLPLRWRIPFAAHTNTSIDGAEDCATVISAVGFGPDAITVEVEFFSSEGVSAGRTSHILDMPGEHDLHVTGEDVSIRPFLVADASADTGNFNGHALVFSDDPRIFVGVYLTCHETGASGFPSHVTNLSAFPVGQTVTFFQAGTPGLAPMPPTAAVTEPES